VAGLGWWQNEAELRRGKARKNAWAAGKKKERGFRDEGTRGRDNNRMTAKRPKRHHGRATKRRRAARVPREKGSPQSKLEKKAKPAPSSRSETRTRQRIP